MGVFNRNAKELIIINNMYGIYIDWQIDNYWFIEMGRPDPHGIEHFKDFKQQKAFNIVEVVIDGQRFITIDLVLERFQLLKRIGLEPVRILAEGLRGAEAEAALADKSAENNLAYLDVLDYYLGKAPWNLQDGKTEGNAEENLTNLNLCDRGRIIVRVMTTDGEERITSANNLFGGWVDDCECLVDATTYDEDIVDEVEKRWSEILGIPVFDTYNEMIDVSYVYPRNDNKTILN